MSKKTDKIIEPIDASFDAVATATASHQVAINKHNKNNDLDIKMPPLMAASKQLPLDLGIEVQRDVSGVEMGVLENGIPYLTQRGLAEITGIARNAIQGITKEWEELFAENVLGKDRISFFKDYLFKNGYREPKLYIETIQNGKVHFAYPDVVCMALELTRYGRG